MIYALQLWQEGRTTAGARQPDYQISAADGKQAHKQAVRRSLASRRGGQIRKWLSALFIFLGGIRRNTSAQMLFYSGPHQYQVFFFF